MFLKSLTLKGFKSFADKTHMLYDPGLTVVVGPNGSGKSNVSDAILWVLGEQSARMLRGQAMEDVIFSGSSARKAVGVAEVTLVLDNSDHAIPVDFNEVGITRRMYRSGESEYLINGSPARLMDIQDILHDSGLGKDTHSIISQGKLDSILQSRPEQRRELIEEAAGISKHRRRKERAAKKLKNMDDNLQRAKDIAHEVTRQLRPLERQVDKAKRAQDIQARLAEVSTMLAIDELRGLRSQWATLTATHKESTAEYELAQYRVAEARAELEKLQTMLEQKGLFVGDLSESRRRMQDAVGRLSSDMRLLEEKGKNMVAKLSELRMNISSLEKQKTDRSRDLSSTNHELVELTEKFTQLEAHLTELEPKLASSKEALRDLDSRNAQLTQQARAEQKTADEQTLAYVRLKEKLSHAELEDSMFVSRLQQLAEAMTSYEQASVQATDKKQALEQAHDEATHEVAELTKKIEHTKQDLQSLRAQQQQTQQKLTRAQASLAALEALDLAAQDANPLLKKVLGAHKGDEHIAGRLKDFIEAPPALEAVVERLLADDLSALVAPDQAGLVELVHNCCEFVEKGVVAGAVGAAGPASDSHSAKSASQPAAQSQGQVTFLSKLQTSSSGSAGTHSAFAAPSKKQLAELALKLHTPSAAATGGIAATGDAIAPSGMLLEHLSFSDDMRGLFETLFGHIYVCTSASDALLAHQIYPGLTYISADATNTMVLSDGRVVVGSKHSTQSGALQRKRSARTLNSSIAKATDQLQTLEYDIAEANQTLVLQQDQLEQAKGTVAQTAGELASVSSELGRLEVQLEQVRREHKTIEQQRLEAQEQTKQARPQLRQHKDAAAAATTRSEALSDQLQELADERRDAAAKQSELTTKLSELRLSLATVRERKRHAEQASEELTRRLKNIGSRLDALHYTARSLEALRLRVQPLHERYAGLYDAALAWATRLQDRASLAAADSESLKKTIAAAREKVEQEQTAQAQVQQRIADDKVKLAKLELMVNQAIQSITADGAYTLEDALALPAPVDAEASRREVAQLKRALEDIGPVNQVAMDEYATLKQHADHINNQVEDLTQARSALLKITAAIERKMKKQFLHTFDLVDKNFQEIFAMLFTGGSAHLEMTDPDHVNETGIEIIAQPRGKRLTKMMLMSGGEKSLTALALLFAVYKTRTVPFYVFDEVEAALDDANLDKLLGALEHLKNTTQLIVISHQRRTMEQADVLYGVSMQADGVSHVVSQRLDKKTGKVVDA